MLRPLLAILLSIITFHAAAKPVAVYAYNPETHKTFVDQNSNRVLSIASITKLMTATVVLEASQPLEEMIAITEEDKDDIKHTRSRLKIGSLWSRKDLLLLALMSSENRAASALSRNYPGGANSFVEAMNTKAKELKMGQTHYVEATGLSKDNKSTAKDLSKLISYASKFDLLKLFSTTRTALVEDGPKDVRFSNTNRLVRGSNLDFEIQKTGYIQEAGHCVVSMLHIKNQPWTIVVLGAKSPKEKFAKTSQIAKQIANKT